MPGTAIRRLESQVSPARAATPSLSRRARTLSGVAGDGGSVARITESGTYILNADLAGEPGKVGVSVEADNVVIELNGFALVGCTGSLDGVTVPALAANIVVRNGVVRGWGRDGVDLSNALGCTTANLRVHDNGGLGLLLGAGARITECVVDRNAGSGLVATGR